MSENEVRDKQIIYLYLEKLRPKDIGIKLGVRKNVIAGVISRYRAGQQPGDRSYFERKSVERIIKPRATKDRPAFIPKPVPDKIHKGGTSLIDADSNACRMVIGEARALKCCGRQVVRGAWCLEHSMVVYTPRKQENA